MTANEKKIINEVIDKINSECEILEELFLQTRSVNLRWIKQSLEEDVVKKLNKLLIYLIKNIMINKIVEWELKDFNKKAEVPQKEKALSKKEILDKYDWAKKVKTKND